MPRRTYKRNERRRPFEGLSPEWCQWLQDDIAARRTPRRNR